jgi:hypothetical protein
MYACVSPDPSPCIVDEVETGHQMKVVNNDQKKAVTESRQGQKHKNNFPNAHPQSKPIQFDNAGFLRK